MGYKDDDTSMHSMRPRRRNNGSHLLASCVFSRDSLALLVSWFIWRDRNHRRVFEGLQARGNANLEQGKILEENAYIYNRIPSSSKQFGGTIEFFSFSCICASHVFYYQLVQKLQNKKHIYLSTHGILSTFASVLSADDVLYVLD
jgi:hypothetical protein